MLQAIALVIVLVGLFALFCLIGYWAILALALIAGGFE